MLKYYELPFRLRRRLRFLSNGVENNCFETIWLSADQDKFAPAGKIFVFCSNSIKMVLIIFRLDQGRYRLLTELSKEFSTSSEMEDGYGANLRITMNLFPIASGVYIKIFAILAPSSGLLVKKLLSMTMTTYPTLTVGTDRVPRAMCH